MQRNLALSAGAIAAEPLYLLLEKHGHIQAHEKSKELAHLALTRKKPLADIIASDSEAKQYWDLFTDAEKNIIINPESQYTGLASKKVRLVAQEWKTYLEDTKT
jgi:adenylosuccinate lyase